LISFLDITGFPIRLFLNRQGNGSTITVIGISL